MQLRSSPLYSSIRVHQKHFIVPLLAKLEIYQGLLSSYSFPFFPSASEDLSPLISDYLSYPRNEYRDVTVLDIFHCTYKSYISRL